MPRPCKCRRIETSPQASYFKPAGVPVSSLEEVALTMDEFEAVRLADLDGMYQQQAAESLNVSRQTFGNIINSAHRKISDALVNGKAIKIEGGSYKMDQRKFRCEKCGSNWNVRFGNPRPDKCPQCESAEVYRDWDGNSRTCRGLRNRNRAGNRQTGKANQ